MLRSKKKRVKRLYIYVSGPYSLGDQAVNVREAIKAANAIFRLGHIPFCPHLSHFWHFLIPAEYEDWMAWDLAWLDKCDILVRLPGESPGADREVAYAKEKGIPVFYGLDSLYEYLYSLDAEE